MPPVKKTCVQCGVEYIRRDHFYKICGYRYQKICKHCISKNKKEERKNNKPKERVCRKCGNLKIASEFKTPHMLSHCLECVSKREWIETRKPKNNN
jgi:NMD protein affecting ribosome stability and mRNA decay